MVAPIPNSEQYTSWEMSRRPTTAVSNNELYDRWASVSFLTFTPYISNGQ